MTKVAPWIQELTEELAGPSSMAIGKTLQHPDGRTVKVMSGQYWGEHGLSNWWTWREVREDEYLGPEESGYGW